MGFAFDWGGEFVQALLEPLQGLSFDHGSHLAQAPNERAAFLVVELAVPHLAIHAARLGNDTAKGVKRVPDKRTLASLLVCLCPQGLYIFVSFRQRVGSFSPVNSALSGAMQISRRLAGVAGGGLAVVKAHALGRQAAQKRLACPFSRGLVVLIGGPLQGVGQAPWHAQAKLFRESRYWHLCELRDCRGSMPTTWRVRDGVSELKSTDGTDATDATDAT
jgi:hypothetical protein